MPIEIHVPNVNNLYRMYELLTYLLLYITRNLSLFLYGLLTIFHVHHA